MADRGSARSISRGRLAMKACADCGFVFNEAFDAKALAYGDDYDNTQSCSAFFSEYLDRLVRHLVEDEHIRNSRIVEVGCGKGLFLRKMVEYPGSGNTGLGFDPSYSGLDTDSNGRVTFHQRYYDRDCANVPADVVICRHVIEHVPQPLSLLDNVRQALAGSTNARVYFETPCIEWILRNRVLWDFFYEHCSLFSAGSLAAAFELSGFRVESVRHIFGGQYLWLEAKVAAATTPANLAPAGIPELAVAYGMEERQTLLKWCERLSAMARSGKLAVWGAGAKGATFVNLVDPECRLVDCVVDLNPRKQGRYIPGTGHPIVDYRELAARGVGEVILMNPNYREENLLLLRQAGIPANLVEWN